MIDLARRAAIATGACTISIDDGAVVEAGVRDLHRRGLTTGKVEVAIAGRARRPASDRAAVSAPGLRPS